MWSLAFKRELYRCQSAHHSWDPLTNPWPYDFILKCLFLWNDSRHDVVSETLVCAGVLPPPRSQQLLTISPNTLSFSDFPPIVSTALNPPPPRLSESYSSIVKSPKLHIPPTVPTNPSTSPVSTARCWSLARDLLRAGFERHRHSIGKALFKSALLQLILEITFIHRRLSLFHTYHFSYILKSDRKRTVFEDLVDRDVQFRNLYPLRNIFRCERLPFLSCPSPPPVSPSLNPIISLSDLSSEMSGSSTPKHSFPPPSKTSRGVRLALIRAICENMAARNSSSRARRYQHKYSQREGYCYLHLFHRRYHARLSHLLGRAPDGELVNAASSLFSSNINYTFDINDHLVVHLTWYPRAPIALSVHLLTSEYLFAGKLKEFSDINDARRLCPPFKKSTRYHKLNSGFLRSLITKKNLTGPLNYHLHPSTSDIAPALETDFVTVQGEGCFSHLFSPEYQVDLDLMPLPCIDVLNYLHAHPEELTSSSVTLCHVRDDGAGFPIFTYTGPDSFPDLCALLDDKDVLNGVFSDVQNALQNANAALTVGLHQETVQAVVVANILKEHDSSSRICDVAVSDRESYLLAQVGIGVSPLNTKTHRHAAHKHIEEHMLCVSVPSYLRGPTSVFFMKKPKFEKLCSRSPHPIRLFNPLLSARDHTRYPGELLAYPAFLPSSSLFIHDAGHYMSPSTIISFFHQYPNVNYIYFTAVLPPEALERRPSLVPDLYQLTYDASGYTYSLGPSFSESYDHPYSSLTFLLNSYLEDDHGDRFQCSLLTSYYAHHLFMYTRASTIPETKRTFALHGQIRLPVVSGFKNRASDIHVPYPVFQKTLAYAMSVRAKITPQMIDVKIRQFERFVKEGTLNASNQVLLREIVYKLVQADPRDPYSSWFTQGLLNQFKRVIVDMPYESFWMPLFNDQTLARWLSIVNPSLVLTLPTTPIRVTTRFLHSLFPKRRYLSSTLSVDASFRRHPLGSQIHALLLNSLDPYLPPTMLVQEDLHEAFRKIQKFRIQEYLDDPHAPTSSALRALANTATCVNELCSANTMDLDYDNTGLVLDRHYFDRPGTTTSPPQPSTVIDSRVLNKKSVSFAPNIYNFTPRPDPPPKHRSSDPFDSPPSDSRLPALDDIAHSPTTLPFHHNLPSVPDLPLQPQTVHMPDPIPTKPHKTFMPFDIPSSPSTASLTDADSSSDSDGDSPARPEFPPSFVPVPNRPPSPIDLFTRTITPPITSLNARIRSFQHARRALNPDPRFIPTIDFSLCVYCFVLDDTPFFFSSYASIPDLAYPQIFPVFRSEITSLFPDHAAPSFLPSEPSIVPSSPFPQNLTSAGPSTSFCYSEPASLASDFISSSVPERLPSVITSLSSLPNSSSIPTNSQPTPETQKHFPTSASDPNSVPLTNSSTSSPVTSTSAPSSSLNQKQNKNPPPTPNTPPSPAPSWHFEDLPSGSPSEYTAPSPSVACLIRAPRLRTLMIPPPIHEPFDRGPDGSISFGFGVDCPTNFLLDPHSWPACVLTSQFPSFSDLPPSGLVYPREYSNLWHHATTLIHSYGYLGDFDLRFNQFLEECIRYVYRTRPYCDILAMIVNWNLILKLPPDPIQRSSCQYRFLRDYPSLLVKFAINYLSVRIPHDRKPFNSGIDEPPSLPRIGAVGPTDVSLPGDVDRIAPDFASIYKAPTISNFSYLHPPTPDIENAPLHDSALSHLPMSDSSIRLLMNARNVPPDLTENLITLRSHPLTSLSSLAAFPLHPLTSSNTLPSSFNSVFYPYPESNTCLWEALCSVWNFSSPIALYYFWLFSTSPENASLKNKNNSYFSASDASLVAFLLRRNFSLIIRDPSSALNSRPLLYGFIKANISTPRTPTILYENSHFSPHITGGARGIHPTTASTLSDELLLMLSEGCEMNSYTATFARCKQYLTELSDGSTGLMTKLKFGNTPGQERADGLKKRARALGRRSVLISVTLGAPGSAKSSRIRDILSDKDFHSDRNLFVVVSPKVALRQDWSDRMKLGTTSKNMSQTFEMALATSTAQILVIDEVETFAPGYIDAFILTHPRVHTVFILGDHLQPTFHEPTEGSQLIPSKIRPEALHFAPYSSPYLFYSYAIPQLLARKFALPSFCLNEGFVRLRRSADPRLPLLVASESERRRFNSLGFSEVYTVKGAVGLRWTDRPIQCYMNHTLLHNCDNTVAWEMISRSSVGLYLINNEISDIASLTRVITNPVFINLLELSHGNVNPGIPLSQIFRRELALTPRLITSPAGGRSGKPETSAARNRRRAIHKTKANLIIEKNPVSKWDKLADGAPNIHARLADILVPEHPVYEPPSLEVKLDPDELPTSLCPDPYDFKEHYLSATIDRYEREFIHPTDTSLQFDDINGSELAGALEQIWPRHRLRDEVTFKETLKKRISLSNPSANSHSFADRSVIGTVLFSNLKQALELPDSIPWDDSLFTAGKADCVKKKLARPFSDLCNIDGRSDPSWEKNFVEIFPKSALVQKMEKINTKAKASQGLACFSDEYLVDFAPLSFYVASMILKFLPDHIYIHQRRSPADLDAWCQSHWADGVCTDNDFEAFDTGQDAAVLNMEVHLLHLLSCPESIIEEYIYLKQNTRCFMGWLAIMRFTGEAFTFIFNTLANIAFTHTKFSIPPSVPQLYAGDDSSINSRITEKPGFKKIQKYLTLVSKPIISSTPEFCSWKISRHGILKNPVLIYLKLQVRLEAGDLSNVVTSYHLEHLFAYAKQDHLHELFSDLELAAHQANTRFFLTKAHLLPKQHVPSLTAEDAWETFNMRLLLDSDSDLGTPLSENLLSSISDVPRWLSEAGLSFPTISIFEPKLLEDVPDPEWLSLAQSPAFTSEPSATTTTTFTMSALALWKRLKVSAPSSESSKLLTQFSSASRPASPPTSISSSKRTRAARRKRKPPLPTPSNANLLVNVILYPLPSAIAYLSTMNTISRLSPLIPRTRFLGSAFR